MPSGGSNSPNRQALYRRLHENLRRNLREMRAAGVRILAGTDIGVLNVVPGTSLHEELTLLVRDANLSPLDAVCAAMRDARSFSAAIGRSARLPWANRPISDVAANYWPRTPAR